MMIKESREPQNASPSVAEFASSIQNLTEIVMGLTKAQGHSGSGECNNARRKRTHSPSSSSSSPETSDASDSDSPVSVSSNDNNPSHPRSKSASVNKASRDSRVENNCGHRGRQNNSPQSSTLSKKATSTHNSRLSHHASSQDGRHSKAHVYDLSDEDEHIPEGLPTLPLQTLKQIRAREFINFNSLLSSPLFSPDSDNIDDLRYKIDFSQKKGFSLKASNPARHSVCDLSSFMEAWNSFLKATLYFYPEMLDEMLSYQKLICELAARYKPVAWLAYDKEHRQECAINHNLQWDKCNTDAFQRHVEGNSLPICYICKRVGHRSPECPRKEKEMPLFPEVNPRFFTPQPQAANHLGVALLPPPLPVYPTPPRPPFHTPAQPAIITGAQFCGLFNHTGRCTAGCPPETHCCNRNGCGGQHLGAFCPKLPRHR